ncbi:Acetyl-CoA acetyltransferase [Hortaea werneckii]|nr:Acetyl-CoA acetyltransferase [Hortaea werneckii]
MPAQPTLPFFSRSTPRRVVDLLFCQTQQLHVGKRDDRKGLVDLKGIDVLLLDTRVRERLRDGQGRGSGELRWLLGSITPAQNLSDGLQTVLLDVFLACEDERDLLSKPPRLLRELRLLVAPDTVVVLLLAVEVVVRSTLLSSETHVLLCVCVRQTVLQHAVDHAHVAELGTSAHVGEVVRGVAHAFRTANDDTVSATAHDRLCAQAHSLHRTGADLVYGRGYHAVRQAGVDGTLSGRVLAEVGLEDIAKVDFLDLVGLNACALHGGLDRVGTELDGGEGGEGAQELADGGAGGREDVDGLLLRRHDGLTVVSNEGPGSLPRPVPPEAPREKARRHQEDGV